PASDAPLEREVATGRFRRDLFYSLNDCRITEPPLRERPEDIVYLVGLFLNEASAELGRPLRRITREAAEVLLRHPWPGNVRELKSVINHAVLASPDVIKPEHLSILGAVGSPAPCDAPIEPPPGRSLKAIAASALAETEERVIRHALQIA